MGKSSINGKIIYKITRGYIIYIYINMYRMVPPSDVNVGL